MYYSNFVKNYVVVTIDRKKLFILLGINIVIHNNEKITVLRKYHRKIIILIYIIILSKHIIRL